MKLVNNASVYANGVSVKHEICRAMHEIDILHRQWALGKEAAFTSVVDGKHSLKSLHYAGLACDVRLWYLPTGTANGFAEEIQHRIGEDYDVILKRDHIHVEFQPKR